MWARVRVSALHATLLPPRSSPLISTLHPLIRVRHSRAPRRTTAQPLGQLHPPTAPPPLHTPPHARARGADPPAVAARRRVPGAHWHRTTVHLPIPLGELQTTDGGPWPGPAAAPRTEDSSESLMAPETKGQLRREGGGEEGWGRRRGSVKRRSDGGAPRLWRWKQIAGADAAREAHSAGSLRLGRVPLAAGEAGPAVWGSRGLGGNTEEAGGGRVRVRDAGRRARPGSHCDGARC